jgi:hypothetical protein
MKVYDGSNWLNAYASLSGALLATSNLSDLNNTATARTNLGVAIGTNVQAYDADLATIAGLTPTNNYAIIGNGTSWTSSALPSSGVTSVTGTSPVVSSGGTTPAISMPAATTSVSGYLTSTDWNTFNGKQEAGSYVTVGGALGTPSSGTLTNCTFPTLNQNTTGTSSNVTGTVAIANGGTGQTTANASFNALNPMTTTGDIIYEASSTVAARLGIGSTGQVLTVAGGIPSWATPAGGGTVIPAGTVILFYQAAAPTGFTQVTTQNNKALRVVSGTGGGTGGTTAFTSVFTNQTVSTTISTSISISGTTGGTTIGTGEMPSHSHTIPVSGANYGGTNPIRGTAGDVEANRSTSSTGGGGSHTHSFSGSGSGSGSGTSTAVTLNVQYIDIILCSKN